MTKALVFIPSNEAFKTQNKFIKKNLGSAFSYFHTQTNRTSLYNPFPASPFSGDRACTQRVFRAGSPPALHGRADHRPRPGTHHLQRRSLESIQLGYRAATLGFPLPFLQLHPIRDFAPDLCLVSIPCALAAFSLTLEFGFFHLPQASHTVQT